MLPRKQGGDRVAPAAAHDEQGIAAPGFAVQRDLGRPAQQQRPVAVRLARPRAEAPRVEPGDLAGEDLRPPARTRSPRSSATAARTSEDGRTWTRVRVDVAAAREGARHRESAARVRREVDRHQKSRMRHVASVSSGARRGGAMKFLSGLLTGLVGLAVGGRARDRERRRLGRRDLAPGRARAPARDLRRRPVGRRAARTADRQPGGGDARDAGRGPRALPRRCA